jgi:acetyltransferase-like isoleucine patch superfamily enzyme
LPFIKFGNYLGFVNIEYSIVHGPIDRIKIGNRCSTTNTLFNTNSGSIIIGDNTIFGHNCMVITGRHRFYNGQRASLVVGPEVLKETPDSGFDIEIGEGCFIGSGVTILAPVKIGNNVIIGSGSIVYKDVPSDCFAAGYPVKVVSYHEKINS